MRSQFLSIELKWVELNAAEQERFAPQIAAGLDWMVGMLDRTERSNVVRPTNFDRKVQAEFRKAS